MSPFDRGAGLARSLAIHHAIPLRQRRLRRLYGHFVGAGDLVDDIGAHAGDRVRAFAALGCHMVALEPQPDVARLLRVVVEAELAEVSGRRSLSVSERTPTVTTLATAWRDARARDSDFARVQWNRRIEIDTTTLDRFDRAVRSPGVRQDRCRGERTSRLAGLGRPVPALSFEYLPRSLQEVQVSLTRLIALGRLSSTGRSVNPTSSRHTVARPSELLATLRTPPAQRRHARLK
jgi:hypothetical protein